MAKTGEPMYIYAHATDAMRGTGRAGPTRRVNATEVGMNVPETYGRGQQSPETFPDRDGQSRGTSAIPGARIELAPSKEEGILSPSSVVARPVQIGPSRLQTVLSRTSDLSEFVPNEHGTSPDSSPESDHCAHDCRCWDYRMNYARPRAYSVCLKCGHLVVVLLPSQDNGYYNRSVESYTEGEMPDSHIAVSAIEDFLGRRGAFVQKYFPVSHGCLSFELAAGVREAFHANEREKVASTMRRAEALLREAHAVNMETAVLKERAKALSRRVAKMERAAGRDVIAQSSDGLSFVYALVSTERPDVFRYIGSTDSPRSRFLSHMGDKAAPKIREWVRETIENGFVVQMIRLWEGYGRNAAFHVERKMIADALLTGGADLNTATVGQRL